MTMLMEQRNFDVPCFQFKGACLCVYLPTIDRDQSIYFGIR